MLLVIKFATVLGLVASSANWVAYDHGSTSSDQARAHAPGNPAALEEPVKLGEHEFHPASGNVCLNGCSFSSLMALTH